MPVLAELPDVVSQNTASIALLAVAMVASLIVQVWTKLDAARAARKAEGAAEAAAAEARRARTDLETATARTATEVKRVKADLITANATSDAKLDEIQKVGIATHTLANNNMAVQLKLNAELSRWKATATGLAADLTAAETSEKLYREHMAKQAVVDDVKAQGGGAIKP